MRRGRAAFHERSYQLFGARHAGQRLHIDLHLADFHFRDRVGGLFEGEAGHGVWPLGRESESGAEQVVEHALRLVETQRRNGGLRRLRQGSTGDGRTSLGYGGDGGDWHGGDNQCVVGWARRGRLDDELVDDGSHPGDGPHRGHDFEMRTRVRHSARDHHVALERSYSYLTGAHDPVQGDAGPFLRRVLVAISPDGYGETDHHGRGRRPGDGQRERSTHGLVGASVRLAESRLGVRLGAPGAGAPGQRWHRSASRGQRVERR